MSANEVLGAADAAYTPTDDTQSVAVNLHICNKQVPPTNESFLGNCEWYYHPLHDEFIDKSGVASWEALRAWATRWNPFDDIDVVRRLLANRDVLIAPNSAHAHWSRHANFMMRHIGCGHLPPDYYISYGYYYCYTYGERLRPRLSTDGQRWLDQARFNLQENIESGLDDNMDGDELTVVCRRYPNRTMQMEVTQYELEVDPVTFKTFAFNTHVPAYLDAGLADLPLSDLMRIGTQPNAEEWLDGETWKQAWASAVEVGWDKANSAKDAVSSRAQAAAEAANEGLSAVEQALSRLMNHIR
ncbi:MAG: hypothetical protein ACTH5D_02925 [Halomonas sp.]|uniref:hypothetical protein n=1 Tax=Halomonas sp. TaxID=1486246 RepID=UPI003F919B37